MKAFAGDNLNVTQKIKFVSHRVGNLCGKRKKMQVIMIFSIFHNFFKGFSVMGIKSRQKEQKTKFQKKTRCMCEIGMPPKRPFFEKCFLYI